MDGILTDFVIANTLKVKHIREANPSLVFIKYIPKLKDPCLQTIMAKKKGPCRWNSYRFGHRIQSKVKHVHEAKPSLVYIKYKPKHKDPRL